MSVITIEEAKAHLKVTTNDDDALILQKIAAAEEFVVDWIGTPLEADGSVPGPVREAVLRYVAEFYDGTPADVGALLAPYREWAF